MRRAGGHCSFFLRGAESERELERARAAKAGRGARARRRSHPRARRRAATMLNNLTDCEDGDGGATPGKRSGAARRGSGSGVETSGGPPPLEARLGLTRAGGAQVGLEPSSIGMRQALCEALECAAPGARTGRRGLATAHGPGADVG